MKYDEYTTESLTDLRFSSVIEKHIGDIIFAGPEIHGILEDYKDDGKSLYIYRMNTIDDFINVTPNELIKNAPITFVNFRPIDGVIEKTTERIPYEKCVTAQRIFDLELPYDSPILITDIIHDAVVKLVDISKDTIQVYPISSKSLEELLSLFYHKLETVKYTNNVYTINIEQFRPDIRIIPFSKEVQKEILTTLELSDIFDFATAVKYLLEGRKVRVCSWFRYEYIYLSGEDTPTIRTESGTCYENRIWSHINDKWELFEESIGE